MKTIKKIAIGSSVFFSEYKDYKSKDKDVLAIMDTFIPHKNSLNMKIKGEDVFLYRNMSKQRFIQDAFASGVPMRAGKFLVPEFAEYIGMEISDLKRLAPLFDQMDETHKYERVIFNAYIDNNSFTLTNEQRDGAYEEYKKTRITNK